MFSVFFSVVSFQDLYKTSLAGNIFFASMSSALNVIHVFFALGLFELPFSISIFQAKLFVQSGVEKACNSKLLRR